MGFEYSCFKGPVAHSGERFHGMEEVVGAEPIGSTKMKR